MPEPVFKGPRDLRRLLGLKVKRNWHQPSAVVIARQTANPAGPDCSNTDRLFGEIPMVHSTFLEWDSNPERQPFEQGPVPYTCLVRGRQLVVTLHYVVDFDSAANFEADVYDATGSVFASGLQAVASTGTSGGDVQITLNLFGHGQEVFIDNGVNPATIFLRVVVGAGVTSMAISNVMIQFNR